MYIKDPLQDAMGSTGKYQIIIGFLIYIAQFLKITLSSAVNTMGRKSKNINYLCIDTGLNNSCPCESPIYHDKDLDTPSTRWNFICERSEYWSYQNLAINFISAFLLLIFGIFTDRYGRQFGMIISLLLTVVTTLSVSLLHNLYTFTAVFILLDMSLKAITLFGYVLQMEMTGCNDRYIMTIFYAVSSSLARIFYTIVEFDVKDFFSFIYYMVLPTPINLSYLLVITESPRWLILNRENIKAVLVVEKIAKKNGLPRAGITRAVDGYRKMLDQYAINDISYQNMYLTMQDRTIIHTWIILTVLRMISRGYMHAVEFYLLEDNLILYGPEKYYQRVLINRGVNLLLGILVTLPFSSFRYGTSCRVTLVITITTISFTLGFHNMNEDLYDLLRQVSTICNNVNSFFIIIMTVQLVPTTVRATFVCWLDFVRNITDFMFREYVRTNRQVFEICTLFIILIGVFLTLCLSYLPNIDQVPLASVLVEQQNYFKKEHSKASVITA